MTRSPVVMIHGAFCGSWVFARWRALFASRGFDVHVPDLRHHAQGAVRDDALGRTSMLDYASDLEVLLEQIGGWPILIGHSLGGLLAQMLAARVPVRALILLAPSPPWGIGPSTPFEFLAGQSLFLEGPFWRKTLAPRRWIVHANALDHVPPDEREAIFSRFAPESGLAMLQTVHWMFDAERTTFVESSAVTCPILCLVGVHDRINSPSTVRRIARRYDGRARFETLPGHSHWLTGEPGWERIITGTLDWIGRIVGPQTARVSRRS